MTTIIYGRTMLVLAFIKALPRIIVGTPGPAPSLAEQARMHQVNLVAVTKTMRFAINHGLPISEMTVLRHQDDINGACFWLEAHHDDIPGALARSLFLAIDEAMRTVTGIIEDDDIQLLQEEST